MRCRLISASLLCCPDARLQEVQELVEDGVVTEKQISKMFDGMPKVRHS